jgi:hypothetical protein
MQTENKGIRSPLKMANNFFDGIGYARQNIPPLIFGIFGTNGLS